MKEYNDRQHKPLRPEYLVEQLSQVLDDAQAWWDEHDLMVS